MELFHGIFMHKENECTKPAMLPDQLRLEVQFFLTKIKMSGFNTSPILSSGGRRDEQLSKRETDLSGIFNETSDCA